MITSEAVRVALTAVFAVVCVWYFVAFGRALAGLTQIPAAISAGLHVLMCVAMISMVWPWGTSLPAIAQVTVFTAGAAWFAGLALFRADGARLGTNWYHAAMMGAMVWMAVAMSAVAVPSGLLASSQAATSTGGMAGMGMSAAPDAGVPAGVSPTTAMSHPAGWVAAVCLVLCAVFFAAGAWFTVAALRALAAPDLARHRTRSLAHEGIGALMAAGMAAVLLEMA